MRAEVRAKIEEAKREIQVILEGAVPNDYKEEIERLATLCYLRGYADGIKTLQKELESE